MFDAFGEKEEMGWVESSYQAVSDGGEEVWIKVEGWLSTLGNSPNLETEPEKESKNMSEDTPVFKKGDRVRWTGTGSRQEGRGIVLGACRCKESCSAVYVQRDDGKNIEINKNRLSLIEDDYAEL